MTGTAGGQVASPDGRWLLTLYLNTKEHKAFVHALNLRAAYAACIDLPSDRSLSALRDYALALAPDGGVYATNAALGVVTHIDLRREAVTDTLRFTPRRHSLNWSASALSRESAGSSSRPPAGKTRTVSPARSRETMLRKADSTSERSSDTNRRRRLARRIARRNG